MDDFKKFGNNKVSELKDVLKGKKDGPGEAGHPESHDSDQKKEGSP